jgi:hypothetical protein
MQKQLDFADIHANNVAADKVQPKSVYAQQHKRRASLNRAIVYSPTGPVGIVRGATQTTKKSSSRFPATAHKTPVRDNSSNADSDRSLRPMYVGHLSRNAGDAHTNGRGTFPLSSDGPPGGGDDDDDDESSHPDKSSSSSNDEEPRRRKPKDRKPHEAIDVKPTLFEDSSKVTTYNSHALHTNVTLPSRQALILMGALLSGFDSTPVSSVIKWRRDTEQFNAMHGVDLPLAPLVHHTAQTFLLARSQGSELQLRNVKGVRVRLNKENFAYLSNQSLMELIQFALRPNDPAAFVIALNRECKLALPVGYKFRFFQFEVLYDAVMDFIELFTAVV